MIHMGLIADQLNTENHLDVKSVVEQIKAYITSEFQPESIYWFGSSFSGQMTKASDIDLAILFDTKESLASARAKIVRYIDILDTKIDVSFFLKDYFDKKKEIGGIAYVIATTGKKIYDKNTSI